MISLLKAEPKHCRWPAEGAQNKPTGKARSARRPTEISFRSAFFCGAEKVPGKPYCAAHCAQAYRKEATSCAT